MIYGSVDYSAATDGISWKYTSRILRFLLANQDRRVLEMALGVLGPHRLFYPEKTDMGFGKPKELGLQKTGQLMGSILSFPILCLANLGVYLVTMRLHQQGWSREEILRHVLVNGDDMVYAAPAGLWDRHVKIAKDLGLKMSVGKAYKHRTYLNINSTSVHCGLHLPNDLPHEIPYLNTGLFFGQHKVQGSTADDHHDEDGGLFSNANVLTRGSLPSKKSEVLARYIGLHKDEMAKECLADLIQPDGKRRVVSRNWFIPISCSGMGIEAPYGWKYYIRPIDRNIVQNLCKKYSCKVANMRPLPGHEPSKLETEKSVPWSKPRKVLEKKERPTFRIYSNSRCPKSRVHQPVIYWSETAGSQIC